MLARCRRSRSERAELVEAGGDGGLNRERHALVAGTGSRELDDEQRVTGRPLRGIGVGRTGDARQARRRIGIKRLQLDWIRSGRLRSEGLPWTSGRAVAMTSTGALTSVVARSITRNSTGSAQWMSSIRTASRSSPASAAR